MRRRSIPRILPLLAALGLVACASSGATTGGASGGSAGASASSSAAEVNICEAWSVWAPAQKQDFMEPIWKQTLAGVQDTLVQYDANRKQIAIFNRCWNDALGPVMRDLDVACAGYGARVTSEDIGNMAGARVPGCIEKAGIGS